MAPHPTPPWPLVLRPEFQEGKSTGQNAPPPRSGKQAQQPPAPGGEGKAGTRQQGGKGPPGSPFQACGTEQFVLIGGMLLVFYFLLIRPQQKQEKARRQMLAALRKGDRVVTTGGIHGVVTNLTDTTVTVRVDSDANVKLRIDRDHVAKVLRDEASEGPAAVERGKNGTKGKAG